MDKRFEDCKVSITLPVVWGEMDAYQHVNNAVYFRYFESARLAYFEKIGVNKIKEESDIGPILASTQCRFKSPLLYPDTVHVATCITALEEDRFTMKYFIKSEQQGRVVAEGEGLIVFYDYKNSCKHVIPKAIREHIQSLDNLS